MVACLWKARYYAGFTPDQRGSTARESIKEKYDLVSESATTLKGACFSYFGCFLVLERCGLWVFILGATDTGDIDGTLSTNGQGLPRTKPSPAGWLSGLPSPTKPTEEAALGLEYLWEVDSSSPRGPVRICTTDQACLFGVYLRLPDR
ncbi:hypothetical protein H101_02923 [Trichophyton interdigitale H6]|nr:hypothetical protein H101_02923 [Trichophyton interdigitale H6]